MYGFVYSFRDRTRQAHLYLHFEPNFVLVLNEMVLVLVLD